MPLQVLVQATPTAASYNIRGLTFQGAQSFKP
jgi:hypothetical protein